LLTFKPTCSRVVRVTSNAEAYGSDIPVFALETRFEVGQWLLWALESDFSEVSRVHEFLCMLRSRDVIPWTL
jgi:hypothetical protein